jgi:cytochrome P450
MPLDDIDLGSWDFWALDDDIRDGAFLTLRKEAPISFHPEIQAPGFPDGPGHWALASYEDMWHVSRHPNLFSSWPSIVIGDSPPEIAEFFGSMIVLDDPRHFRLRSIVQKAFTPKMVSRIEEYVRDRARRLVEDMVTSHPDGTSDIVQALSGPLPLQVICDMMGIPEEDHAKVFYWTNVILGVGDEEVVAGGYEEFERVAQEMAAYGMELADSRRSQPGDDLTTNLVQAELDGERLSDADIASFFILLGAAGNETTRNAISHGVAALTRYPDEKQRWFADYDRHAKTAVEEIVRWASPVIYMRRRVTEDTEVGGVKMNEGEKVTMWYCSANRDESKFADPYRFDLTRDPNPQVGYGSGGPHFCLGANLARREITMAFAELHRQVPDLVAVEEPAILVSPFIHGIKRLPVAWDPDRVG